MAYMVNSTSHVNKYFKEQVEKFTNGTFVTPTQPFIRNTTKKNNTYVLALVMLYDTRHKNATESFRVLSCLMYNTIDIYVSIDYTACQSKHLSDICIDKNYL